MNIEQFARIGGWRPKVRWLQPRGGMSAQAAMRYPDVRQDGFGSRRIEQDAQAGRVEVLDVSPVFATPAAEQAIRARAARLADSKAAALAPVVRVGRVGQTLSVTTAVPEGITLADLLGALEFGTVTLTEPAVLDLAGATIRAVGALHEVTGAPAHGALNPAHILLRRDGSVVLTGALFADALQSLQYNRERLWREFGVALPPSASLPRFDQRADVTQLGALVLAILLRRTLAAGEYPKGVADLVGAATARIDANASCASALQMWLQQALQLHPKAMFASAVDAVQWYNEAVAAISGRRAAAQALQAAVRRLSGGRDEETAAPTLALPVPQTVPVAAVARQAAASRGFTFLRNVFPPIG